MSNVGHYTTKGLYNHYDKKHKTRDAYDYYATPTAEVTNILNTLNFNFSNQVILEPCAGEGYMAAGIMEYINSKNLENVVLVSTEYQKRENKFANIVNIGFGQQYDFLSDDYEDLITKMLSGRSIDWIVMNPPYSTIEPFTIRALELAQKGVIMLGRLQFLEGKNRYNTIFTKNPPTDVCIYIDRIQCYKNGDFSTKDSSAQAYAWFVWDKEKESQETICHWIKKVKE